jgi:hypothetical protein
MKHSRIQEQFNREAESWRRLLDFLLAENVHLKTRIAEIAVHDMQSSLLARTEDFQNRFIQNDRIIIMAKRDLKNFEDLLATETITDESIKKIFEAQRKLRQDFETLNRKFNKLRIEFNKYLAEKL